MTAGLPGLVLAVIAVLMYIRAARVAGEATGISGHLQRAGLITILVLAFASVSDYPVRTPILSAILAIAAIWAWSPSGHSTTIQQKN